MADKKISALTAVTTPLAGTEVLPIVQSSTTKKVASDDLTVKNVRSNATTGILQVAGPAAAATRTMTTPDANFTVARTDAGQTFTGDQIFTGSSTATIFVTSSGTAAGVSGTYYDILTAPTLSVGLYLVTASIGVGQPSAYFASAYFCVDNTALRRVDIATSTNLDLRHVGQVVSVRQTSGAPFTIYWSVTRLA